jgi:hypothetical protein
MGNFSITVFFGLALVLLLVGCFLAMCYPILVLLRYWSKEKQKPCTQQQKQNDGLPKGYKLIKVGDNYMVKTDQGFVDMVYVADFYEWSLAAHVNKYCLTNDKQFAIKRANASFDFNEAMNG